MTRILSIKGLLLSGVILSVGPFTPGLASWYVPQTERLVLPSTTLDLITVQSYHAKTSLNIIKTDQLSGDNRFEPHDTIYVHIFRGPENSGYPFAISHNRPKLNPQNDHTLVLRGIIDTISDDTLYINYGYENFRTKLSDIYVDNPDGLGLELELDLELQINPYGHSRLAAIHSEQDSQYYPLIDSPVLFGFMKKGAKSAPPT